MPGAREACELTEYTGDLSAHGVGIWPLWICPVRQVQERHATDAGFGFPVTRKGRGGLMFNVGVYGVPNGGAPFDPVVVNRALEDEVSRLGGRKMMYAQSFYTTDSFWRLFNRRAYEATRARYHAAGAFPDVPTKALLGEVRLAKMAGVKPVSFAMRASDMFVWYWSLWSELLLPRALHGRWCNVLNTGEQPYTSVVQSTEAAETVVAPKPTKTKSVRTPRATPNKAKK